MVKVITVHGTFAGDEKKHGDKWWQIGSPFLTRLQGYLNDKLEIDPFPWSGRNSEIDRRKFGIKLYKKLNNESKQGEAPPIVIGHSHGGTIGVQAMAHATLKHGDDARGKLSGFMSVGMPFIAFLGNRNPFARLNIFGRLLLLVALALVMAALAKLDDQTKETVRDATIAEERLDVLLTEQVARSEEAVTKQVTPPIVEQESANALDRFVRRLLEDVVGVTTEPGFWFGIGLLIVLFLFTWRSIRRTRILHSDRLEKLFGGKFAHLIHSEDEVVNAFQKAISVSPELVTWRTVFVSVFSTLALLGVVLVLSLMLLDSYVRSAEEYGDYTRITNADGQIVVEVKPDRFFLAGYSFLSFQTVEEGTESRYKRYRSSKLEALGDLTVIPMAELFSDEQLSMTIEASPLQWPRAFREYYRRDWFVVVNGRHTSEYKARFTKLIIGAIAYSEKNCIQYDGDPLGPEELGRDEYRELVRECALLNLVTDPQPRQFIRLLRLDPRLGLERESYMLPTALTVRSTSGYVRDLLATGKIPVRTVFYYAMPMPSKNECDRQVSPWGACLAHDIFYLSRVPTIERVYSFVEQLSYNFDISSYSLPDPLANFFLGENVNPVLSVLGVLLYFATLVLGPLLAAALISALIATGLKPILAGYLENTLKSRAFGNDGFGERVVAVSHSMNIYDDRAFGLPNVVETEMINNSLQDAPAAISRLRGVLKSGDLTSQQGMDAMKLAVQFDKSELLHNAYFHSADFIRYMAALMVVRFGLTPSAQFKEDDRAMAFKAALEA